MKNLFYLLSLMLLLISCCVEPIKTTTIPQSRKELLKCDTEDNIINIDNGGWLQNSNLEWENWEYYQIRGFQLNTNEFIITSNNDDVIVNAKILNVSPSLYTKKIIQHKVIFKYKNNLFNSGDVIDVELKIQI